MSVVHGDHSFDGIAHHPDVCNPSAAGGLTRSGFPQCTATRVIGTARILDAGKIQCEKPAGHDGTHFCRVSWIDPEDFE